MSVESLNQIAKSYNEATTAEQRTQYRLELQAQIVKLMEAGQSTASAPELIKANGNKP